MASDNFQPKRVIIPAGGAGHESGNRAGDDGRWIAEIPDLPGVMAYGRTREEAVARAKALALRVLADGWSTMRRFRNSVISSWCRHEPLAIGEGLAGPGRLAANRLVGQTPVRRLPPGACPSRLARLCIRVSSGG